MDQTKKKLKEIRKLQSELFAIGNVYFRKDKNKKPTTKFKCIPIKKSMGWCDDKKNKKSYNKLIKIKKKLNMKNFIEKIINMIF